MPDVVIRFQTLDSTWEVGGSDRKAGIVPEHVKYSADENGSLTASFDLRRDSGRFWPDLSAFTPVDIEVDGVLVWSGRIKETPTRETAGDSVINVQCEGWQYHLDDDLYEKDYVRTRMSDWQDARTFLTTDLTVYVSGLYVNADNGKITIGNQDGNSWPTSRYVGIALDMGPAAQAKRIVVTGYRTGGTGASSFWARGASSPGNWAAAANDAISNVGIASFSTNAGVPTVLAGTFPTASRYVTLFMYNGGATYTSASPDGNGDVVIITGIQVFTDTAYESGNTSTLVASTVVSDALKFAPLLSTDTSKIATTSFVIPDFGVRNPQTPRETQDAINSFHNYVRKVDVNRRLVFQPKPSVAVLAAGKASNIEIEDASANSGEQVYNSALITAIDASDIPLLVRVAASQVATSLSTRAIASPAPANPSADVDASNWSSSFGSVTRSTTTFDTSPGAIQSPAAEDVDLIGVISGTFKAGTTYVITFSARTTVFGALTAMFGDRTSGDYATSNDATLLANTWKAYTLAWTPRADTSSATLKVQMETSTTTTLYVDSVSIAQGVAGLVDRRGFTRTKHLPLEFPATLGTMTQIGSIYLADHIRTPFKGSVVAHGYSAINITTTGEQVPIWVLPTYTTELLRLNNRIDPDTGGLGRDGRIAQVDVDVDAASATIQLDSTRNNFEAYLARLALVTGTKLGS